MMMATKLSAGMMATGRVAPFTSHQRHAHMMPAVGSLKPMSPVIPKLVSNKHRRSVIAAVTEPLASPDADLDMFCYQCEQTLHGEACTTRGVCGKTSETAALQDLLIYQLKGLSSWARFAHEKNITTPEVDSFVKAAIFSTLTNVNFDSERFVEMCLKCDVLMKDLRERLQGSGILSFFKRHLAPEASPLAWFDCYGNPINFDLLEATNGETTVEALARVADKVDMPHRKTLMKDQETLLGLHELLTYGLKGMAAYAHHAEMLGAVDSTIDDFCEEVMAFLAEKESQDPAAVLAMCMKLGEVNFRVMQMLDNAHTSHYGHPVPTQVPLTPTKGKAILISGHDMHDLEDLLKQTQGLGINVYTHGEMLPGHGYPGLKQYPHLYGNYGGAWYRQRVDFANFPGPILMTTNCIVDPLPAYADHIFTTGEVGVKAAAHLATKDFSAVIKKALEMPGFTFEPEEHKNVTVGFGHHTVLSVADKVLGAVAAGQLSHIFVIGGCDNFEKERKYYTEVAKGLPSDTMVLTLGCGKYRFYDHDFGHLANGLPRLLDMGQCNDAYGALVVATKLAEALNTDVNSLPLSLDISWFEQKAVAVLLTLLHLGIRNVRLGPNLPAFVTPDALQYLVEHFNIMPADTKNPLADVDRMMANA